MKKLLYVALAATFAITQVNAQFDQSGESVTLLNYDRLERKVEKSNENIEHHRRGKRDRTWRKRGELFQDVFAQGIEQVQEGMGPNQLQIFYGEPNNVEKETREDGTAVERYEYDHIIYIFTNGTLLAWERKDPIHEEPLQEALRSYKKAMELDDRGRVPDKIKPNLEELKLQFKRSGVNYYYKENYQEALEKFKGVLAINDMPMFEGVIDTLMIQYTGIISREIANQNDSEKMYKQAIKYYKKLAKLGTGGANTYLQLKLDYFALGDTTGAIEILKEGHEQYPDSVNIIANIADTYIVSNRIEEGLDFIEKVIKRNPDLAQPYYWKGRLLINKEEKEPEEGEELPEETNVDKAVKAYKKAAELDETLYYVWYDMGYIYFLQGADFYERASLVENDITREKLNELGTEKYKEAIPMLENAFEFNEANREVKYETLDLLQRIYYKEQMMDEYNRVKKIKNEL